MKAPAKIFSRWLIITTLLVLGGCGTTREAAKTRLPVSEKKEGLGLSGRVALNGEEKKLAQLINGYRQQNGLAAIPLSPSLTLVAQIHVRDLDTHPPRGECNMHSWSASGSWSSCCYTPDHVAAQCMWNKPRELTAYPGNGYENSHGGFSGYQANASTALASWRNSEHHNAVILNRGMWEKVSWKALGVGVHGGYAVIWFGEEGDPEGVLR